ncbi:MAG: sulfotransferase domain-containing protein [Bacteroidetes bacterium]|nr:sulfotransferase domain-containing protein [Bacteroidota bacterium]
MLIVSSGMQKSGTAYFYNILNDLIKSAGENDARILKEEYNLGKLLKWRNNNVDGISGKELLKLVLISRKKGIFAVKTHYANRRPFIYLLKLGIIKVIYSYRDPRDVILSAMDHGRKLLAAGDNSTFAKMTDTDEALKYVSSWIKDWKAFSKKDDIYKYKYEDLISDPERILDEVMNFIDINVSHEKVREILYRYNPDNPEMPGGRLHFNKAVIYRYKTEMSENDLMKINDAIGNEIINMGYLI